MRVQKIGFIGLGAMGDGMTRNLLKAGYDVRGYDINPDATARLASAGGQTASSAAEAAADADMLIVCVFSADQAQTALFGDDGAVSTLGAGATVIMSTTMAPEDARAMAERLAESDHLFIDAPVTGGKAGADAGTLTVIASGPEAAMAAADGPLKAMGDRINYIGAQAGAGSSVKMINQLLVGVHVVAAAEAIALATRAGVDPNVVYDVITHGQGNSLMFQSRVKAMMAGDYETRGALEIFPKDLGIVMDAGRALNFPLPLTAAALEQYEAAMAAGLGRADNAAVVKVYEQRGGINVAKAAKKSS
jgi:3-hydroxyisobutyrate dehydrogenase